MSSGAAAVLHDWVDAKTFSTAAELEKQFGDDLAVLIIQRFASEVAPEADVPVPHPASGFVGHRTALRLSGE